LSGIGLLQQEALPEWVRPLFLKDKSVSDNESIKQNLVIGTVLVTWAKPHYKPHDKKNLVFWKPRLFKL
jgi:hypothetical protein